MFWGWQHLAKTYKIYNRQNTDNYEILNQCIPEREGSFKQDIKHTKKYLRVGGERQFKILIVILKRLSQNKTKLTSFIHDSLFQPDKHSGQGQRQRKREGGRDRERPLCGFNLLLHTHRASDLEKVEPEMQEHVGVKGL